MKPTDKGEWIHVTCAMWIPDLTFDDDFKMVMTDGLTKRRAKLVLLLSFLLLSRPCPLHPSR
jgi:hypothetical protein